MRPVDYTGRRSGRLVAIRYTGKSHPRFGRIWQFQCDCGKMYEQIATRVFCRKKETQTAIRSCGCLNVELCLENVRTGKSYRFEVGHKPFINWEMKRWLTQPRRADGAFVKGSVRRVVRFGD